MIAIQTVVSIAALYMVAFWLYNSYRVDLVRQDLFELRAELFDAAVAGKISFDSKAYKATRILLNGMIRYAHRLSISRFVAFSFFADGRTGKFAKEQFESVAFGGADVASKSFCEGYIKRAHLILARHMLRSPALLFAAVPLLTFFVAKLGYNAAAALVQRTPKVFVAVDEAAWCEGKAA